MIVQTLIKIFDTPIPSLANFKNTINNIWIPQADTILLDDDYTEQDFTNARSVFDRFHRYKFVKRILSKKSLKAKYQSNQIALMEAFKIEFEGNPTTEQQMNDAKLILQKEDNIKWANKVKNDNGEWVAWKNKSDNDLNEYLARKEQAAYKDGDFIFAHTPTRVQEVWEEMLQNGRTTEKQYRAAKLPDGTRRWPYGTEEVKVHQAIILDDASFTDEEVMNYNREKVDTEGETIRRRNFKVNIEDIGISSATLEKIRDKTKAVRPRYDKTIPKVKVIDKDA